MSDQPEEKQAAIAIVGPCASGKTTLADRLRRAGWQARQIVQEHSYVPSMWRTINPPDLLIYLDASYEICTRRKQLNWSRGEYLEQIKRLADARERCDFYLNNDDLSIDDTAHKVIEWLNGRRQRGEAL